MRNADRQLLLARILGARKVLWRGALLVVAYICFQVPHQAPAQSFSSREYEINAAYLYNFTKYVDRPSYGDTISNAVLCKDPFGKALAPLHGKITKRR